MATDTATAAATASASATAADAAPAPGIVATRAEQGKSQCGRRGRGGIDEETGNFLAGTHVNVYRMSSVAAKAVVRKETTYSDCQQLPTSSQLTQLLVLSLSLTAAPQLLPGCSCLASLVNLTHAHASTDKSRKCAKLCSGKFIATNVDLRYDDDDDDEEQEETRRPGRSRARRGTRTSSNPPLFPFYQARPKAQSIES